MKPHIVFEEKNRTIRQMPENYLLAESSKGYWICDPDSAADWKIVKKLFRVIFFGYETKWGSGENLINRYNKS